MLYLKNIFSKKIGLLAIVSVFAFFYSCKNGPTSPNDLISPSEPLKVSKTIQINFPFEITDDIFEEMTVVMRLNGDDKRFFPRNRFGTTSLRFEIFPDTLYQLFVHRPGYNVYLREFSFNDNTSLEVDMPLGKSELGMLKIENRDAYEFSGYIKYALYYSGYELHEGLTDEYGSASFYLDAPKEFVLKVDSHGMKIDSLYFGEYPSTGIILSADLGELRKVYIHPRKFSTLNYPFNSLSVSGIVTNTQNGSWGYISKANNSNHYTALVKFDSYPALLLAESPDYHTNSFYLTSENQTANILLLDSDDAMHEFFVVNVGDEWNYSYSSLSSTSYGSSTKEYGISTVSFEAIHVEEYLTTYSLRFVAQGTRDSYIFNQTEPNRSVPYYFEGTFKIRETLLGQWYITDTSGPGIGYTPFRHSNSYHIHQYTEYTDEQGIKRLIRYGQMTARYAPSSTRFMYLGNMENNTIVTISKDLGFTRATGFGSTLIRVLD